MTNNTTRSATAERFFSIAEKARHGNEDAQPDYTEAVHYYRRAADLGFAHAYLRLGEMCEHGVGVSVDLVGALSLYKKAADAGQITGYAAIATMVSATSESDKADLLWRKFFSELARGHHGELGFNEPAASIHSYVFCKLSRFEVPNFFPVMNRYRHELVAFMQKYLEHATNHDQLEVMEKMVDWVTKHLS